MIPLRKPAYRPALLWLFALSFLLSGCSTQLVAHYDQGSLEMTQKVAIQVEIFFTNLEIAPKDARQYSKYRKQYARIQAYLNALLSRNKGRIANELTVKQIEIAIKLWQMEQASHKKRDTILTPLINTHRKQFADVFHAIIQAEQSKIQRTQQSRFFSF